MSKRRKTISLTAEAKEYLEEVEGKRKAALTRARTLPIAVLIWGPSPKSRTKIALTRKKLKELLIKKGHLAEFSEDLFDATSSNSNLIQQVAQVEAYDITLSIPESYGSIAEIHDFARMPMISNKIVTFLDTRWDSGYSNQSLIQLQSNATCRVIPYDGKDLPDCIINHGLDLIQRLQDFYYTIGRRI